MKKKKYFRLYSGNPISGLITVFILTCIILTFLLYREHVRINRLYQQISKLNDNLSTVNTALASRDYEKADSSLAQTQKDLVSFLHRTSLLEQLHVKRWSAPPGKIAFEPLQSWIHIPATRKIPSSFVLVPEGEYLLFCEKKSQTLSLYKYAKRAFSLVKTYPAWTGKNRQDKSNSGDMATPEGVYILTNFIPGKTLPALYGYGAFVLNYPNFWDVKNGKNGHGIWIHGHDPKKEFSEKNSTLGCIKVGNENLAELTQFIKPGLTPITIVNETIYSKPDRQKERKKLSEDLTAFLNSWKQAWESLDNQKYFAFYAPEFTNKNGMNLTSFKKYKQNVVRGKKFVKIALSKTVILTFQKAGQEIVCAQFDQNYKSNNLNSTGRKTLYLKKFQQKWLIIGED